MKYLNISEYNVNGDITNKEYLKMDNDCKAAIEKAETELFELYEKQNSKEDFKKQIDTIRFVLRSAQKDAVKGIMTKEFAPKHIDKIFVTPQGDKMKMDIKILQVKPAKIPFTVQRSYRLK